MAGDYIPMDHDLPDKPEFAQQKRNTGATDAQLMYALFRLWRFFDRHTEDGFIAGYDIETITVACGEGVEFWKSLVNVGWLAADEKGVSIPNFRSHFRSSAKERMRKHRRNKAVTDAQQPRNKSVTTVAPQNQNQNQNLLSKESNKERSRFIEPTLEEVSAYCRERGNSVIPDQFLDHYIANGWVQARGKPIRNWQAAVRTWEKNNFGANGKKQDDDFFEGVKFDEEE